MAYHGPDRMFNPAGGLSDAESKDLQPRFSKLEKMFRSLSSHEQEVAANQITEMRKNLKSDPKATMATAEAIIEAYAAAKKQSEQSEIEQGTIDERFFDFDEFLFLAKLEEFNDIVKEHAHLEEKIDSQIAKEEIKRSAASLDNLDKGLSHGKRGRDNTPAYKSGSYLKDPKNLDTETFSDLR